MAVITRLRDDGGRVYVIETAFFYTIGRCVAIELTLWVRPGSPIDRYLAARAR